MNERVSLLQRFTRWLPVWTRGGAQPGAGQGLRWGLVGMTLLLQFALQAWFFPLVLLNDGTPLLYIDSASTNT